MHLADLVVARSIIGCAARPSSALRYNVLMRAYQGMRLNVRHAQVQIVFAEYSSARE